MRHKLVGLGLALMIVLIPSLTVGELVGSLSGTTFGLWLIAMIGNPRLRRDPLAISSIVAIPIFLVMLNGYMKPADRETLGVMLSLGFMLGLAMSALGQYLTHKQLVL